MCYFLYMASPLTLSEVRSMLPPGLTADLLPAADQRALRTIYPDLRSGLRILRGACSCDLVIQRDPEGREDESHLRARWLRQRLPRERVIRLLDVHRRANELRVEPLHHWRHALASFVAEHERNAGPTLYYLRFSHEPLATSPPPRDAAVAVAVKVETVRECPDRWLEEDRPTTVSR